MEGRLKGFGDWNRAVTMELSNTRGSSISSKGGRTWQDEPSLPTIKTDWVNQSVQRTGLVQSAPAAGGVVLHQKSRFMPELAQSNKINIEARFARTWGAGDDNTASMQYLRLPRLSMKTGRYMDDLHSNTADLSDKRITERRTAERSMLGYNQTDQYHMLTRVPPLLVHVCQPDSVINEPSNGGSKSKVLEKSTVWTHDPVLRKPGPYARTRNDKEARVVIPMEQGGMFMAELDPAAMDGSLQECIAGETYTFGVSLRYGYGQAKTGTDLDRQMLEDWMVKLGGLSAYLTGTREIPCTCTHVAEGAYAFSFNASATGQYQLWIFVGPNSIPGSPFPVFYHAGPPHGKNCQILGVGLWSALVGEETFFEWKAKDAFGNVVDYGGHPFMVSMYGPEEIVITLDDHQDGTYKARYTATVAGEYKISVTLDGQHLPGSPFLVTVREGGADPGMSTVTGEGLLDCQVGQDRHFLIEAVDKFGNRVSHGGDSFVAKLEGPIAEKVHLIDMDDGTYAGLFMCRWAGHFECTVTLNGSHVANSPYPLYVRPGPSMAQNCESTLVKMPMSRLIAIAGVPCSFSIFAKDKFGNQRDEGGDEFMVKARGPGEVVMAVITDNKDGTYQADFTCTKDGDYFIDVKLDRLDIQQSPFLLSVDPASTCAYECLAEGVENDFGNGLRGAEAGRAVQFIIYARDQFGNAVIKPGDDFQVKISEVNEGIRVRATVSDNGDGTYLCEWTGMLRGEYDVAVCLKEDPIKGSPWRVCIRTGQASATKSTAEGSGLGGSQAGVPNSVLVEANDHFGNVVTRGGAHINGTLVSVDGRNSIECAVEDHEDGTYTVTYVATRSCEYFLAVRVQTLNPPTNDHIHESPFLIFIDHTDTDPTQCKADGRHAYGDGLKTCSAGEETGFQVFAHDKYANKCTVGGDIFYGVLKGTKDIPVEILDHQDGHYTCTYTAIWAGEYNLHLTLNEIDIQGSPWHIRASVADLDPASCYISGSGIYTGVAGVESEFHIQAKDKFENIRPDEDPIEVTISGPEKVTILRRYVGDGQYDFFWTANLTGLYEVDIFSSGVGGKGPSLGTAPYYVNVGSGPVYPINCVATGDDLSSGVCGVPMIFVIQSKDKFGNARSCGGDMYLVSISGPAAVEAKTRDQDNGRYTVSFTTFIKGTYWISITLDGEEISGSPYLCDVKAAAVDVGTSKAEGMGLLAVGTFRDSTFVIHSYDKYGNHLDTGGDAWQVSIVGAEMPEVSMTDNDDGTYKCTYQSTVPGQLQVYVGIKGRELPDCPFEVVADSKVRRKQAQEKQAQRAGRVDVAAKKREEAMLKQQGKKTPKQTEEDIRAEAAKAAAEAKNKAEEEEEEEENAPEAVAVPTRGSKLINSLFG